MIQLLKEREEMFEYLKREIDDVTKEVGEVLVAHPRNPISLAVTLDHLDEGGNTQSVTSLGSQLFTKSYRCVSLVKQRVLLS